MKVDWIPNLFRRRRLYHDISEEIQLHIEEHAEELMRCGMSAEEAAREAHKAFGNRTLVEERSREVWQWPIVESVWSDARFALRQMRRFPGFAVAAVLTMALAIGTNVVVFGVLNRIILHPLDVPNAASLYHLKPQKIKLGINPIPTISTSVPATIASRIWRHSPFPRPCWTRVQILPESLAMKPVGITSTCWGFTLISVASSMPAMNAVRTAPRMSCWLTRPVPG